MSVQDWSPQQVKAWAVSKGFPEFAEVCISEDVDGECLLELTPAHLRDEPFKIKFGRAVMLKKELEALRAQEFGEENSTPSRGAVPTRPSTEDIVEGRIGEAAGRPRSKPPTSSMPATVSVPPPTSSSKPAVSPRAAQPRPPSASSQEAVRKPKGMAQAPRDAAAAAIAEGESEEEEDTQLRAMQIVTPIASAPEESPKKGGDKNAKQPEKRVSIDRDAVEKLVEQMMEQREGMDIEVAVVSVMGKFRGGKSFLLNILATYFLWLEEHQEHLLDEPRPAPSEVPEDMYQMKDERKGDTNTGWLPEWLPEEIQTPFTVDAKSDTKTCTQGLWLLNRVFFLRSPTTLKKIAVLLMDSQGADDGYLDESQSRAILGITTVFSSTVIYNVKMPLDVKHVKDLGDLANIFQVALGDCLAPDKAAKPVPVPGNGESSHDQPPEANSSCVFGRLFFFLRDAKFTPGENLDQCRVKVKKDSENKLDPEKAANNREIVKQLHKSFSPLEIYGLSHPGDSADFARSATTNGMRGLNDNFKRLLDEFVRSTFEVDFPTPVRTCLTNKCLTASKLVEYLERIKDGFAGCMVAGGDPELIAMHREEVAEDEFVKDMDKLKPEMQDEFPKLEIGKRKKEHSERFSQLLKGKGLSEAACRKWVMKFDSFTEGHIARRMNLYTEKQGHGDRAVVGCVAGVGLMYATPLGPFMIGHWAVCLAGAGVGGIGGYYRHANDNRYDVLSEECLMSFQKTSIERSYDMVRSGKRFGYKAKGIFEVVTGAANRMAPPGKKED